MKPKTSSFAIQTEFIPTGRRRFPLFAFFAAAIFLSLPLLSFPADDGFSSSVRACDPDEFENKKKKKEKEAKEKKEKARVEADKRKLARLKKTRAMAAKKRAAYLERLTPGQRERFLQREAKRAAERDKKNKKQKDLEAKRATTLKQITEQRKAARKKLHAKALEKLKSQIQFANSSERMSAVSAVFKLPEGERKWFIPHLIRFAEKDSDPLIRKACLDMLAKLEIKTAGKVIVKSLEDDYPEVRRAAVSAVNKLDLKTAAPVLIKLIKKEDFKVNNVVLISMINSLGRLKEKREIKFFRERAVEDDTHAEVRNSVVLFFGRVNALETMDYLHKVAADEDTSITTRSYAINSIGRMKQPKSLEPLRKLLKEIRSFKNKSERVRYNVMKLQLYAALIRLGDKSVHARIIAAAKNNDANVRVRAIKQLGDIRLKAARPMLCYKFKHDGSRAVRKAARAALKKIDGKEK